MKALLTSVKCSCCKNYTEIVKSVDPSIHIVPADSTLGQKLLKEHSIKGLPAIIYNGRIIEGKYSKAALDVLLVRSD